MLASLLPARNLVPFSRHFLANALVFIGLAGWVVGGMAQQVHGQGSGECACTPVAAFDDVSNLKLLNQIEVRSLPPVVLAGPPRFSDLPSYYWAENGKLRERFEAAKQHYAESAAEPYRALTLVAGSAGIGKTFIKQDIFSKDCSPEAICKFDLRELLEEWKAKGLAEERPDLFCGDVVLSSLPAIKKDRQPLLRRFLESQPASFFVIDSLDEVHPDSYESLLKQIEQFVSESDRQFLHVVVLGRPLAFRDYWQQRGSLAGEHVSLFMLQPPRFLTTGDLMVSSWNYHTWRYRLRWQADNKEPQIMPVDTYMDWVQAGFPESISGHRVLFEPNQSMDSRVHKTIESWAQKYPVVNSMLSNLAGNGMIREIAEEFTHDGRSFDERAVMEAYLARWLERHTKCENRPSSTKPEHLDLYLQLVEGVAVKYLQEDAVDSNGFFHVSKDDHIEVLYRDHLMHFPIQRILDRSGLKYLDPREEGVASYRFEPVWFHRLLVTKHIDLQQQAKR